MKLSFDVPRIYITTGGVEHEYFIPLQFYVTRIVDGSLEFELSDLFEYIFDKAVLQTPKGFRYVAVSYDKAVPVDSVEAVRLAREEDGQRLVLEDVRFANDGTVQKYSYAGYLPSEA